MENKISKQKKVSRQKAAAAIARIIEAAQIVTNYEQQYCNND
jgi:hypothetical protein